MTDHPFRLQPLEVHVWSLDIGLSAATCNRLESAVSAAELACAGRLAFAADRRRHLAARGLLRVILAGYLRTRPERVPIEIGPWGKPRLAGQHRPRFNLTHAGDHALLAVSAGLEVGIDLEELQQDTGNLETLARTCLSPVERTALSRVAAPEQPRAFLAAWTRKEAFLKAVGEGLSRPLDSFDVSLAPGEPARLLRVQGMPDAPQRYTLCALEPFAGYVAALAHDGPDPIIRYRPWQTLLSLMEKTVAPRSTADEGRHLCLA